ncbi:MAG: hypothetical protein NZ949_00105, partial [Candidatus Kapabacteria bacterium]|nr:hypothetical protein [Candidatus Kapabacteria bacterium]MDW7997265.1 hypothetical protein [Bacteroidota bacterium]
DTSAPRSIAWLVGVALAAIPSETPLHFAQVQASAQKQTVLSTRDGRLSILFCRIGRLGIRAAGWATVTATDDGLTIHLYSPTAQEWNLRLSTLEGRQCWQWQGAAEGSHTVFVPIRTLSSGLYLLSINSAREGELQRLLLPLTR